MRAQTIGLTTASVTGNYAEISPAPPVASAISSPPETSWPTARQPHRHHRFPNRQLMASHRRSDHRHLLRRPHLRARHRKHQRRPRRLLHRGPQHHLLDLHLIPPALPGHVAGAAAVALVRSSTKPRPLHLAGVFPLLKPIRHLFQNSACDHADPEHPNPAKLSCGEKAIFPRRCLLSLSPGQRYYQISFVLNS